MNKTLKKALLCLAGVACLVAVALCITAFGSGTEPDVVVFYMGSSGYSLAKDQPRTFITDAAGVLTEVSGAEAENYNIKLEYPSDGTPVIRLRGAYFQYFGNTEETIGPENIASKTTIVIEKTDTGTVAVGSNTIPADSYISSSFGWKGGELVVEGASDAKLRIGCIVNMHGQAITFKSLGLDMTGGTSFASTPEMITFDGCTANLTNSGLGLNFWDSRGDANMANVHGITVKGNAVVNWTTKASQVLYGAGAATNAKILIESGSLRLHMTDGTAAAIQQYGPGNNLFDLRSGTLEVINEGTGSVGIGTISTGNYKNAINENTYWCVKGDTKETATPYDPNGSSAGSARYFRFEAGYKLSVTEGTASVGTIQSVTKAPAGATVKLTPVDKGTDVFDKWVTADNSAEIDVQEEGGVYTFTMPAGNVSVAADYLRTATVGLVGQDYTFTEGEVVYFTTSADGTTVTKLTDVPEDTVPEHQIRLEVVNDIPTMFLNGAMLAHGDHPVVIESSSQFAIHTEAPSTIKQSREDSSANNVTYGAIKFGGKLIFQGDELLTLAGGDNAIVASVAGAELLFDHANVVATTTGGQWGCGVISGNDAGRLKTVVVDGGSLVLHGKINPNTGGASYYILWNPSLTFTIKDNANVTFKSDKTGQPIIYHGSITVDIQSGYLYAEANHATLTTGKINIGENGTFEAYNKNASGVILAAKPTITGNPYKVMGASKTTATEQTYNAADTLSGRYVAIGRPVTVTATNGTVQTFGEPGTQVQSIVGVDVTVSIPVDAGQTFEGWSANSNDVVFADKTSPTTTFKTPASDVTVEASLVRYAKVKLDSIEYEFADNAPKYFTTNENGKLEALTEGESEDLYNVKLAFNGTMPTVYLKSAFIAADADAILIDTGIDFAIHTVTESRITHANAATNSATEQVSAGTGAAFKTNGNLTVTGSGLLKAESMNRSGNSVYVTAAAAAKKTITFLNANVEFRNEESYAWNEEAFRGLPAAYVFDGGKVTIASAYLAILMNNNTSRVDIINGAELFIDSQKNTAYGSTGAGFIYAQKCTVTVDGILKLKTKGGFSAIQSVVFKGGSIDATSSSGSLGSIGITYDLADAENYMAVYGASKAAAVAYTEGDSISNLYFHIGRKATVNVTGGTAKAYQASGEQIDVIEGDAVTLTPTQVDGKALAYWTSADLNVEKVYTTNYTFTMPSKNVAISATLGNVANYNIAGQVPSVVQGGATIYYKTDASGTVSTTNANESNYNIKIEYLADTQENPNNKPTIYLRDAYIYGDGTYGILSGTNPANKTIIIVEKTDAETIKIDSADVATDSYIGRLIYWSVGELEIRGPGKLTIDTQKASSNGIDVSGQLLTFTDLDLVMNVASGRSCFVGTPVLISFNGGTASLNAPTSPAYYPSDNDVSQGIVVNNANVTMVSGSKTIYSPGCPNAKVVINSGSLTLDANRADQFPMQTVNGGLVINGGTFQMSGPQAGLTSGTGNPVLSGYRNSEDKNIYYAQVSENEDGTGATRWVSGNSFGGMRFFKVEPGYAISVVEGTPSQNVAPGGQSVTVTLTTDGSATAQGKGVKYWTSTAWGVDAKAYDTYTFTMPYNSIEIRPTYDLAAQIKIGSVTYEAVRGGKVKYYNISNSGTITETDGTSGYNMKFEYATGGTTATLSLRDAYIKNNITNGAITAETTKFLIEKADGSVDTGAATPVEADSYLTGAFTWTGGDLVFEGESQSDPSNQSKPSKLKIAASGTMFSVTGEAITFNNLNLDMSARTLFGTAPTVVTFSGGTTTIRTSYLSLNFYDVKDQEGLAACNNFQGFVFTNNAVVDWESTDSVLYAAAKSPDAKIVVESGSVSMRSSTLGRQIISSFGSGVLDISGGTVEFSTPAGKDAGTIGLAAIDTSKYLNAAGENVFYAASGADAASATEHDTSKPSGSATYFKLMPARKITVRGGTAKPSVVPVDGSVTVTLTPDAAPDAKQALAYWTSAAFGEGTKMRAMTYTFSDATGPIEITANYGRLAQVYMLSSVVLSAVEDGATHYYAISGTKATEVDSQQDYNAVFSYPLNGTPTLRLKGISGAYGIYNFNPSLNDTKVEGVAFASQTHLTEDTVTTMDLVVEIEGTNSLTYSGGHGVTSFAGNSLTFRSIDNGTLSMTTWARSIKAVSLKGSVERASVIFDDANVTLNTTSQYQPVIELANADVTVDGGVLTLNATATNSSIFRNLLQSSQLNINICGDAIVEASAPDESSSLWDEKLIALVLDDYVDGEGNPTYAAVASTSKDAFMADPESSIYNAGDSVSGKRYFRVEPKEVKVQITWGAMSFTYSGTIWNVETHQWEGNWVPSGEGETQLDMWWNTTEEKWDSAEVTDAESLGLDSNQIRVVNTGTETFIVKFDFTAAEDFATNETNLRGTFVDARDEAIGEDGCTVVRFAEADAFLKLNSAAVAGFADGTVLGVVTVVIDAVTPAQGGNA